MFEIKSSLQGTWYFDYDRENRLVKATRLGFGPDARRSVVYSYDALGRRVSRQERKVSRTEFIYDGMDVIQDRKSDSSGASVVNYVNGLGIDNKLKQTTGSTTSYFLTDHLGSTVGLADQAGSITSQTSYDSFGNTTGPMPTRYGYTGREYDEYTGLMYYRARFYDPQIGRFISEDPIEFEGGINWYAYVDNDPINFIDPYGFDKFKLPDHPSKLLPEWKPDPTHKNPNGQRFRHPNGDFLDFHPKNPNKSPKTHGGNDHWHHNGDKKHLYPEDEIELKPDVCEEAPAPDPMPFTPLAPPPPNWLPWWLRFPLPSFPLLPIMINPCIVDPHFPGCPLENLA